MDFYSFSYIPSYEEQYAAADAKNTDMDWKENSFVIFIADIEPFFIKIK